MAGKIEVTENTIIKIRVRRGAFGDLENGNVILSESEPGFFVSSDRLIVGSGVDGDRPYYEKAKPAGNMFHGRAGAVSDFGTDNSTVYTPFHGDLAYKIDGSGQGHSLWALDPANPTSDPSNEASWIDVGNKADVDVGDGTNVGTLTRVNPTSPGAQNLPSDYDGRFRINVERFVNLGIGFDVRNNLYYGDNGYADVIQFDRDFLALHKNTGQLRIGSTGTDINDFDSDVFLDVVGRTGRAGSVRCEDNVWVNGANPSVSWIANTGDVSSSIVYAKGDATSSRYKFYVNNGGSLRQRLDIRSGGVGIGDNINAGGTPFTTLHVEESANNSIEGNRYLAYLRQLHTTSGGLLVSTLANPGSSQYSLALRNSGADRFTVEADTGNTMIHGTGTVAGAFLGQSTGTFDDTLTVTGGGANITGTLTVDNLIQCTGDIVAYYTSDRRVKDNITPLGGHFALHGVQMLGGYTFDWNDKAPEVFRGQSDVGVIAQEVRNVIPQAVKLRDDGMLGVEYHKIIPLLIEAIKELNEKVEALGDNGWH